MSGIGCPFVAGVFVIKFDYFNDFIAAVAGSGGLGFRRLLRDFGS